MRFSTKHFFILSGITIILIVIIAIFLRAFTARAGVYNLYATSCLGGWENTHLASGAPDVKEGDNAIAFTTENSARLNPNTHAQIYCGGFTGDILESTIPQKILVKFSWMAELYLKPSLATETIAPAETPSTDNESIIVEIETLPLDTEAPVGNEPALSANPAPMDLVPDITPELTQPELPQEPALSDREPASLFESFLPLNHTEYASTETTENAIKTTDIPATTPPTEPTPHGIVEVLYTLDGSLWKSLGFVERNEFGNKHFEIPIEEARAWVDISKIQIGIRSMPAIDRLAPIVYLDSVWIEVEYQVASEDPLIPPGEKEGDVILSEIKYENMIAVLESVQPDMFLYPSDQELLLDSASYIKPSLDEAPITAINENIIILEPSNRERNLDNKVRISKDARHSCAVTNFRIDISGQNKIIAELVLNEKRSDSEIITIGSLPSGIDITFLNNADYKYSPIKNISVLTLQIINQLRSQKGDFNIPILYTSGGETMICQLNVINMDRNQE